MSAVLPVVAGDGLTTLATKSIVPVISRNVAIALSVVLLHVAFIYALYSGLLTRAVELVVPAVVLAQFIEPKIEPLIEPPKPKVTPPPPAQPQPVKKSTPKPPAAVAPAPLAIADPTPAVNAPLGVTTPQPAPAPIAAPVAAVAVAPPAPPARPVVQLPSSDADYLQNPLPPYPAISKRLNEKGVSTIRVLIGTDGRAQRAEVAKSSGFTRLDEAALATSLRWRYVPGKRDGVPEAMWINVPIVWVLD